jgi:hypothetical protein
MIEFGMVASTDHHFIHLIGFYLDLFILDCVGATRYCDHMILNHGSP